MTTTGLVEFWSDVGPLPDVRSDQADIYLRFPARTTADRALDALRQAGYKVRLSREALLFCVLDVDPLPPLRRLVGLLTPPESRETLALLRPSGSSVKSVDYLLAMDVASLRDRVAGTWLIELLRARNLTCVFQPIVRADDRTTYGYEGLVRGIRNGDQVSPSRMIDVAKSAHLMSQLDALAMQTVLAEAAKSKIDKVLFVNCTPSHIFDPATRMAEVGAYCDQVGLKRSQVVLEVVETEKNDPAHLRSFIGECRANHFRVALDDLGSGYSTISTLSELRPDIIKIDRGFVTSINADPIRALILSRMLEAARILGFPTIVEGIETEAELAWATANSAVYVQGHLLGAPGRL
jgi:EAL domain-containing protein (putative c-di-GMP-specific phosphodiesterase class I)